MNAPAAVSRSSRERGPAPEGPSQDTVAALRALILAAERFRQTAAAHLATGLSETMALGHLSAAGSLTPRQLAGRVGLTPSTVTALLDRLETGGLASRAAHPTDRRKTVVTLTERGEQSLDQLRRWITAATTVFEAEQLPEVTAMLATLAVSLDAETERITRAQCDSHAVVGRSRSDAAEVLPETGTG